MSSLAAKLKKGTKVKITAKGQYNGQVGFVRYVGPIQEKKTEGDYVGLELQRPIGKNNGTHNGKKYFQTKPNYGIFLKPTSLANMDGTPVVPPAKVVPAANKLSKDLEEVQKGSKVEETPEEQHEKVEPIPVTNPVKTEKAEKQEKNQKQETQKAKETDSHDYKAQIEELKKKVKTIEQENRTLRIENEKVKYAVKDKDQGKQNQLKEQIQFYKGQKQAIEKQKAELKKKNAQLNAELEQYAENIGMVDTLTIKNETLEAKNEKMKQELQATKTQLKNYKMTEESSGKSEAELNENLKILNETVALLQSDLKDSTDKVTQLQGELKKKEAMQADFKKIERKLKQKEQQVQQMSNQLELMSDTANFVQKLTLNMLKKDQQLKQATTKLAQFLTKYQTIENELAINKQFSDELNQQLFHQEELMDRYSKQIEEKNKHILELNRQLQKYKKKLFDLTQSNPNQSTMVNSSQISEEKQQLAMSKMFLGDQYQNKYYNALKVNNQIRKNELKHLIQFSQIRNQVGVYILNLTQALPESFTTKLYPEVMTILTSVKSANDKLYYIFLTVADTFKNKQDIYSKENQELAQWLIVLLKEVIMLYGCLHKIEFALTTAENEEQVSEILEFRALKDEVRKVNNFSQEILERFVDDNISASVQLQTFITAIQSLDQINLSLKRTFNTEYQTKMRLCTDAMDTVSNILQAIMKYKHTNQLGENAEVDNSLELFMRTVLAYVRQCCMNPYIRFKSEMKQYLEGLTLISNILGDIGVEGNYHELNSLYSETENIKMLRETILTTQYHANTLENDLKDIVYTSEVSKIQTQLPGKFWQERIKQIREELLKVKQVSEEKAELQHTLNEAKKKNLLLERDIKDKQSTKELYEKRIGQLQLKVEQVSTIENQNKRQAEKIKSYEDANKVIEQEIVNLTKKNKLLQDQNKKIKQKFDTLQTETMMRNKKQKNLAAMSSQDVANLTIFKNAIKESNQLRTVDIKKKLMMLKQSPIYNYNTVTKSDEEKKISVARAKALDQISKFTVNDPFATKKNSTEANMELILLEIDRLNQNKVQPLDSKNKNIKIGQLLLGDIGKNVAVVGTSQMSIIVS